MVESFRSGVFLLILDNGISHIKDHNQEVVNCDLTNMHSDVGSRGPTLPPKSTGQC